MAVEEGPNSSRRRTEWQQKKDRIAEQKKDRIEAAEGPNSRRRFWRRRRTVADGEGLLSLTKKDWSRE